MGIGNLIAGTIHPLQKVGDIPAGDYVDINKTQGIRYKGDTTVWKDMIADLFGRRLYSSSGSVDYDYNENAIIFSPSGVITDLNDRIGGNQEINHEFKVGSNIIFQPHLHWWQQVTSGAVLPIIFTARYRIQRLNQAKETSWTTITAEAGAGGDDVFNFTAQADGLYNQITKFDDIVIDCGISDTIQFQLTRSDSQIGDVSVYFLDIHGEVDSDGSDTSFNKT
jgi:hypothetical protein